MAQLEPACAKSYIAYDRYGLQQPDGQVLHVEPGMSVPEFRRCFQITHKINKKTVDLGGVPLLPGQKTRGWFYAASEIGKKFSRSLFKKLEKIESEGLCILNFVEDHIRVFPGGGVKLRGIQLVSRADLGNAAFEVQRRNNYEVGRTVVHNLFNINGTVPADINRLLNMITHHAEPEMRCHYPNHVSLKPLGLSPSAFKDLHDIQLNITDAQYQRICSAVVSTIPGDWRDIVSENALLEETYYYRGGAEYEVPWNTPNQRRLSAAQAQALRAVGITTPEDPTKLTPNELLVIDGHLLLKFLRHRLAHRTEAIENGYYTWNRFGHVFTTLHSELVILVHFPTVLATVQYELHLIGQPRLVFLL